MITNNNSMHFDDHYIKWNYYNQQLAEIQHNMRMIEDSINKLYSKFAKDKVKLQEYINQYNALIDEHKELYKLINSCTGLK